MKNNEVYIIYADTYTDSWGAQISLFGIATNKKDMEKIYEKVKEKGYFPIVEKVELDKFKDVYLGGYFE